MVDPSELVLITPQPANDFSDDVTNGRLFWQCESYDEYRLHCTIEGIESLYTRREFDVMKSSLNTSHLVHLSRTAKLLELTGCTDLRMKENFKGEER